MPAPDERGEGSGAPAKQPGPEGPGGTPVPPPSPPPTADVGRSFWIAVGGCAAIILGSLGPWVNAGFITVSGLDGDGVITLVCGLAAGAVLLLGRSRSSWQRPLLVSLAAAMIAGATAIYDIIQIYDTEAEIFGETVRVASPGWGIWMVVAGAVALLLGIWLIREDSRARARALGTGQ